LFRSSCRRLNRIARYHPSHGMFDYKLMLTVRWQTEGTAYDMAPLTLSRDRRRSPLSPVAAS
jgi:hypothetical protein